jgi:hypothetical protein
MRALRRKAKRSTDPYPATIRVGGETLPITLAARGKSRRTQNFCAFPPLRVRFEDKPPKTSLFRGQKGLKLVTHCGKRSVNHQNLLQEYAAYRILNTMTDQSLRVRMANVTYVDSDKGTRETFPGFFIEDTDEAAERVDMVELDLPDISTSQLDPEAAARTTLFHYIIGNFDFSVAAPAPGGSDCCHNTKLTGAYDGVTNRMIPVPYDFDYSGLVNASYVTIPENIGIRNARQRIYRGYCRHNQALLGEITKTLSRRAQIMAAVDVPGMTDRTRAETQDYISDAFDVLSDPKKVERNLIGKCR